MGPSLMSVRVRFALPPRSKRKITFKVKTALASGPIQILVLRSKQ
jgi:hypothetical protein